MKIKRWHIVLGILISAVFLFLSFRKIEFNQLWQYLRAADWAWVLLGLVFYFMGVWVRTWRWQVLLKPLKHLSRKQLFPVVCIGYMGNNVYPARAGEVLRSILLKQSDDVPISGSLATIVVERLFDGITILALVLLNFRQFVQIAPDAEWVSRIHTGSILDGGIFGLILFVFLAMLFLPKQTQAVSGWLINKLLPAKLRPKVSGILDKFIEGLRVLRSPGQSLLVLALSMLVWVLEGGLYWGVMKALGLDLSFMSLLLVEGVVNLVLLIPAAPGGLGTFDAAARFMLSLFGIPAELALGYALMLRVALWIPITALGAIFFVKEGFSLSTNIEQMQTDYSSAENTDSSHRKD
ncbi:MAG: lysylphosphatidylglycerol synthase transmembrane domain-containing protein [Anaerolineaceae bacterium]|nr:lysylphosphatidylglycerol synthase transmembrane domain-containing protein [Anaerolineaceae bacterium]